MELYLAADSGRLQQALSYTDRIAHMNYRISPEGTLLASPLPEKLRGGLLMLCDEGGRYPADSRLLCEQLLQECMARRYAGILLDAAPPEEFCRRLDEALFAKNRLLYLPPQAAAFAPHGTVLLCTAATSGSLEDTLRTAVSDWGAERLALDLQRMMLDYPLTAPAGSGTPLTPAELHTLAAGRSIYFSRPLCARYFTYHRGTATRFVLFDDRQTLQNKIAMAEQLGIREGFFMLPEVEDLAAELFREG